VQNKQWQQQSPCTFWLVVLQHNKSITEGAEELDVCSVGVKDRNSLGESSERLKCRDAVSAELVLFLHCLVAFPVK